MADFAASVKLFVTLTKLFEGIGYIAAKVLRILLRPISLQCSTLQSKLKTKKCQLTISIVKDGKIPFLVKVLLTQRTSFASILVYCLAHNISFLNCLLVQLIITERIKSAMNTTLCVMIRKLSARWWR